MKRVLAIAMAVAMLFSLALVSSAGDAPAFKLSASAVENGEITVTLSAPTLTALKTLVSYIEFDPAVVEPIVTGKDADEKPIYKGGAAGKEVEGDFYPTLVGSFAVGMQENSTNKFGIGFMNPSSTDVKNGPKAIYTVVFKVLNAEAANTTFKFYVTELDCTEGTIAGGNETLVDTLAAIIKVAPPTSDKTPPTSDKTPPTSDNTPPASGDKDDENPNTGVNTVAGVAALCVMLGAAVVVLRKKED
ncbi:MAG: NPXTG-anchored protein [Clostridiales bacterium]|nr:NPXTG-anchored protein [Clostridiales bacterium]